MNEQYVFVFAKWQVRPGELAFVLKILEEVASKSRKEKGNVFYRVHQNKTDPNMVLLYEAYVDEEAVEAHRNSMHFQKLVIGTIVPRLESREVQVASML